MEQIDPATSRHEFARLLRQLRHKAGFTQEELAAAAGLSSRALGNLERSRSAPHRDTVDRLARILDLSDAHRDRLRRLARQRAAPEYPTSAALPTAAATRLPAADDTHTAADPAAGFRCLASDAARLFCVIGLHPTRRVTADLMAAAAATSPEAVRPMFQSMAQHGLLAPTDAGEFELSPLAHQYARAQAGVVLTHDDAAAARGRLIDWYLASAAAADQMISPRRFRVSIAEAVAERPGRVFGGRTEAIAWCDTHDDAFAAVAELADRCEDSRLAWQIPWALGGYLNLRRPPALCLTIHQVGLESARRRGDVLGQAAMLTGLGDAHYYPRRFDDAAACFRESRRKWQALGEPRGEAGALNRLGNICLETRRFGPAVVRYQDALELFRNCGDRHGESTVLANLAETYCEMGRFTVAADRARAALRAARQSPNPRIDIMARCQLARALAATTSPTEAGGLFQEAVTLSRDNSDHHALAWTLTYLGDFLRTRGSTARAKTAWQEAIEVFDGLGDPHAAKLRAQLLALKA